MKILTKKVLVMAAAVLLLFTAATTASAQCTSVVSATIPPLRAQGSTEAVGTITIACAVTPVASVPTNISVTLTTAATTMTPAAGSTTAAGWTSTCSATAADFIKTFSCPSLSSTLAPVGPPGVSVSGNVVNFNFTPSAGTQTFTIQGIRISRGSSGLQSSTVITASVAAGGGVTGSSNVSLGIVGTVLGSGNGFTNATLPLNILSCSPSIPTPSGMPTPISGNPDPSVLATNSLKVSFVEGFLGAFTNAAVSDNGAAGVQGVRFRIQLTGIPVGMVLYVPEQVKSTSDPNTGSVVGGGATTVMTLVSGTAEDGSGGTVLLGATANLFDLSDLITPTNGTATIIYEVTASSSFTGTETVNIFIAITGTATTGVGLISGSLSLAPAGLPTVNAAMPQFAPIVGGTNLVGNVVSCTQPQPVLPASPAILLRSPKLAFVAPSGSNPDPQAFDVLIAASTPLSWTAAITPISGGNWLSLSPTGGKGSTIVTATVNSKSLPLGSYSAEITLTAPDATNSPLILPVVLDVAGVLLSATPSSLNFTGTAGTNPPSQQLAVASDFGTLSWTAAASTTSGGNWLSITPASGSTPGTVTVSVNAANLAAGVYHGTITVTAPGAGNGSQTVNVTLTLGAAAPTVSPNGILNGASFSRDAVLSPGSIASVFGVSLASTTSQAASLPLPVILGGTQVLVNDVAAPLFYVSPTQINFQVPLLSGSSAQVLVVSNQLRSQAVAVKVAAQAPGIFTAISSGSGQAAALNQDQTVNSTQNPAKPGSVISIYATGLGATTPPAIPGQPASASTLSNTVSTPVVFIGGVAAEVLFSGLAPGFAGAYQVNVRIPAAAPTGDAVLLVLTIGGVSSNSVTIAVR